MGPSDQTPPSIIGWSSRVKGGWEVEGVVATYSGLPELMSQPVKLQVLGDFFRQDVMRALPPAWKEIAVSQRRSSERVAQIHLKAWGCGVGGAWVRVRLWTGFGMCSCEGWGIELGWVRCRGVGLFSGVWSGASAKSKILRSRRLPCLDRPIPARLLRNLSPSQPNPHELHRTLLLPYPHRHTNAQRHAWHT